MIVLLVRIKSVLQGWTLDDQRSHMQLVSSRTISFIEVPSLAVFEAKEALFYDEGKASFSTSPAERYHQPQKSESCSWNCGRR
ncbi:hypothetical protein V1290_003305 [Bradyrhizobium sp. AZCC 1578]